MTMTMIGKLIELLYLHVKDNKVYYDMMTGLHSRYYYDTVIREKYIGKEVLVVYVDIDNLKKTNDEFGHYDGTQLIKYVASEISRQPGVLDACRIGGDEFLLFFEKDYDITNILIPEECSYGYCMKETWEDLSSVVMKSEKKMYAMKEYHHNSADVVQ